MRIAVIGTGISGNLAARLLSTAHDVHVFEANGYVGGHAHTHDVTAFGDRFQVDTGFMVFNERTYPNFTRMLRLLGIAARDSDMSFSVRCERTRLEYQGSDLNGMFAQRRNLFRPRIYRLITDVLRFNARAVAALERGDLDDGKTVGQFLRECRLGDAFVHQYLVPMTAAIWSARPAHILEFPARFMIGFCRNHGLLQLRGRPRWKTILGGSRKYVSALVEPIRDRIRLNCPVQAVTRTPDHVVVQTRQGDVELFDRVVFATHADQTLKMLTDATNDERRVLQAFPFQRNDAVLHTDTRLLPRRPRAWASWNYHVPADDTKAVTVTYDLSRLQGHASPSPILLTLNRSGCIDEAKVLARMSYAHPAFSRASIAAQQEHARLNGCNRTYYCGAYWGFGFHEDGVNSALAVAGCFGLSLDSWKAASTKVASSIAGTSR